MWLGICWRWRFTGQEQPEVKILPPGIMIEARSWHGRTGHSILFHSQERDHSSREERREGKTSLATEDKEATHRRRNNRMGGTTSQVAPRGVPLRALDSETIARWWVGSGKWEGGTREPSGTIVGHLDLPLLSTTVFTGGRHPAVVDFSRCLRCQTHI